MEGNSLVIVSFLWMLPRGLNGTVTLQPNLHSTNFRSSEVTATSDNKVSPLEMTQESLNNAPNEGHHSTVAPSVELKLTVKSEPQTSDQVSTRKILSSDRPSIQPLRMSTKRNSQSPQDRQTTRYKNKYTVEITADGAQETLPTMWNQPRLRQVRPSSKDEVSPTASPRPIPSELSTQTTSQTPNQPTEIQTEPTTSNPPTSQSNDSTERNRPTPTAVGFGVTPTRAKNTLNIGGEGQLSSIPSQAAVTSMRSTPSHPTERGPTGPSSAATSPTTLPPSTAMTKSSTHVSTTWTLTQPAKTLATTEASVNSSIAVTSSKSQSTPMVPTNKQVATATTTAEKKPKPQTKTANKDKSKKTGNHGTVVAVLIGGTLFMMLVGFGVIFVRKQRQQRMRLQNTAWAGPSPFLDGGVQSQLDNDDSGDVHLSGSNGISFSGFLSQRLSNKFSLIQDTDQEFQMGENPSGSTFGRETVSDDVKPSNGTAALN